MSSIPNEMQSTVEAERDVDNSPPIASPPPVPERSGATRTSHPSVEPPRRSISPSSAPDIKDPSGLSVSDSASPQISELEQTTADLPQESEPKPASVPESAPVVDIRMETPSGHGSPVPHSGTMVEPSFTSEPSSDTLSEVVTDATGTLRT